MPPKGPLYDVFVSHNRADKAWARNLARLIATKLGVASRGLSVFFDESAIGAGESIPSAVREGLARSRIVLLVMSPDWVRSEWCQLELDTEIMRDPAGRHRTLVPILLRECEIPPDIARLKFIDFRDAKHFRSSFTYLIVQLRECLAEAEIAAVLRRQHDAILNTPIMPWVQGDGPSLDLIWPGLYVDPLLCPSRHPQRPTRFKSWAAAYDWKYNIAVVGAPGIGKSMLLRTVFLELAEHKHWSTSRQIPILTTASEVLKYARASRKPGLLEWLASIRGIPYMNGLLRQYGFALLVDGLDEISDANVPKVVHLLQQAVKCGEVVLWLACRKIPFIRKVAARLEWSQLFYEILELQQWPEDKDALLFAKRFADRTSQPKLYRALITLRRRHPEMRPFLGNPFELTLLLYLLQEELAVDTRRLVNSYDLYSQFYQNWLIRESDRGTATQPHTVVQHAHYAIARALYRSKGTSLDPCDTLAHRRRVIAALFRDSSFVGLLLLERRRASQIPTLSRFWHETIGEFLVAASLIEAFISGGAALKGALETVYHDDVNRFVRGRFESWTSRQRQTCLENLIELYLQLLARRRKYVPAFRRLLASSQRRCFPKRQGPSDSENARRIREQILYYIGRLPATEFPSVLRFAYWNENDALLRRSAALGAILHGDEGIEREYVQSLVPDSADEILNRSVQLVYFGDVDGDIHTYRDDGRAGWERTRGAIYYRLARNSPRDLALRWWDLRTLYCFLESRSWSDPVTQSEYQTIARAIVDGPLFSAAKRVAIRRQRVELLSAVRSHVK